MSIVSPKVTAVHLAAGSGLGVVSALILDQEAPGNKGALKNIPRGAIIAIHTLEIPHEFIGDGQYWD